MWPVGVSSGIKIPAGGKSFEGTVDESQIAAHFLMRALNRVQPAFSADNYRL